MSWLSNGLGACSTAKINKTMYVSMYIYIYVRDGVQYPLRVLITGLNVFEGTVSPKGVRPHVHPT